MAASGAFILANMTQGLIVLNNPEYILVRWHGTLIYWLVIFIAAAVNICGTKILPRIEVAMLVLYVTLFFALLIPLLVMAPKQPASFVFGYVENNSGWESDGIAWCIGLLSAAYCTIGCDGPAHMSESTSERCS